MARRKSESNLILGIETSCDECSVAVVRGSSRNPSEVEVLSVSTFSQIELHRPFGGVVPEVASRNHLLTLIPTLEEALRLAGHSLDEISAIGVTNRPGLIGSLLVGVTAAKALCYSKNIPLIPIHHLEGHLCSIFLRDERDVSPSLSYPLVGAVISGGHTQLYRITQSPDQWSPTFLRDSLLAQSRDDAAGETFDKTAKLLGLDYPGGSEIERLALTGDPKRFPFPRPLRNEDTLDFSFSGLKTAIAQKVLELKNLNGFESEKTNLAASAQEAILESICNRIDRAAKQINAQAVLLVGGVAANQALRRKLSTTVPIPLFTPPIRYCTDNAAMIAAAAHFHYLKGDWLKPYEALSLNAHANAET